MENITRDYLEIESAALHRKRAIEELALGNVEAAVLAERCMWATVFGVKSANSVLVIEKLRDRVKRGWQ